MADVSRGYTGANTSPVNVKDTTRDLFKDGDTVNSESFRTFAEKVDESVNSKLGSTRVDTSTFVRANSDGGSPLLSKTVIKTDSTGAKTTNVAFDVYSNTLEPTLKENNNLYNDDITFKLPRINDIWLPKNLIYAMIVEPKNVNNPTTFDDYLKKFPYRIEWEQFDSNNNVRGQYLVPYDRAESSKALPNKFVGVSDVRFGRAIFDIAYKQKYTFGVANRNNKNDNLNVGPNGSGLSEVVLSGSGQDNIKFQVTALQMDEYSSTLQLVANFTTIESSTYNGSRVTDNVITMTCQLDTTNAQFSSTKSLVYYGTIDIENVAIQSTTRAIKDVKGTCDVKTKQWLLLNK